MERELTTLVSIMICFYNEEEFLSDAVESIIGQSYSNWELILVDDGSTDGSTSIARQYAGNNPDKIIYLEHEGHANKGLSSSRNTAVAKAKGDVIAILDADDVWLRGYLEKQMALITANPEASAICEATEYWYYNGEEPLSANEIRQVGQQQDYLYKPFELVEQLDPLARGHTPCLCGLILRKEMILKHGGFEEQFKGMFEDQAFMIKLYLNEPVYISSLCNNRYRQHVGSLCWTNKNEGQYDAVRKYFLKWLEQYMIKHGFNQGNLQRLLKRALEPYQHPYKYGLKKLVFKMFNKIFGVAIKRRNSSVLYNINSYLRKQYY